MAKIRISLSLEPDEAELIRQVAADNGLDVSGFLVMAGVKEAVRLSRIAAGFSELDAAIAEAEVEADALDWPPDSDEDAEQATRLATAISAARTESAAHRHGGAAA